MKVCNVQRDTLYAVLNRCHRELRIRPRVIELGVLRGDNAQRLNEVLAPELLLLVDAWSSAAMAEYTRVNAHRDWVDDIDVYAQYFGGPASEQETFDRLHRQVCERFAGQGNVRILRADTRDALARIRSADPAGRGFDLIYVDANHQYETVFDDLMACRDLVSDCGVLQLNDCCHSDAGVRQNLGVLEAVVRFVKVTEFVPVALTNSDFSDLILARRGSPVIDAIDRVIDRHGVPYVEVPHQLLGAARVRGRRPNISFL